MQRERRGEGLTVVGVQQGQGALSAPIHPSLRDNQRKTLDGEKVTARNKNAKIVKCYKQPKCNLGNFVVETES